jgi:hypothetical protein
MILQIEDGDVTLQKKKDILSHAIEYYKKLFGPSEKPIFNLDSECWDQEEKVTEEENESLTKPFSVEELKSAIFFYGDKHSSWSWSHPSGILSKWLGDCQR